MAGFTIPQGRMFVTVTEASLLTGFNPGTIRLWVKEGKVPAYGFASRMLLNVADILPLRPPSTPREPHRVQGLNRKGQPKRKPTPDSGK